MTDLDKLVSLGAYSCGGDLLLDNKIVGYLRNGNLYLTDDGKRILEQDSDMSRERPKRVRTKIVIDSNFGVPTVEN